MPRYEYRCEKCDKTWERTRPIVDTVEKDHCPMCKKISPQVIRGGNGINGFAEYGGEEAAYDGLV